MTRNPSAAQIENACNQGTFQQGTLAQCMSLPVGAIVDLRVRNLARLLTDGLDFNSNYERPTDLGTLDFTQWAAPGYDDFAVAQTPDQALDPLLNTQNEPINLRIPCQRRLAIARAGARRPPQISPTAIVTRRGFRERRVASWTTIDLHLRYDFPDNARSWLAGTAIEFNARNFFNVDPPFLNNQVHVHRL